MLPKDQLLRLSIEQEKALLKSDSKLDQLKRFKSDYQRVSKQLRTLPDRLDYPMMIPFGKKAFIPGKLIDTNEILVLLGENWFVECSAKYAREIAERRIKQVDKSIDDSSKEHENISSSMKYTKEFSDNSRENSEFQEIIEYESESGEITTIKGPNMSDGVVSRAKSMEEKEKALSEFESKLVELQRAEEYLEEGNRRKLADARSEQIEDTPINESLFENEIMKIPYTSTIEFHHTESSRENEVASKKSSKILSSPADIYENSPELIRKSEHLEDKIEPKRKVKWAEGVKEPSVMQENRSAFSNIIKERNPLADTSSEKDLSQDGRIVSKFKLTKMK